MTDQDITAWRLANQCINGCALTPGKLLAHLGAMQAQDYPGALWSIGLRTSLTQAEVTAAIARRAIVRTWPQRGTLHFVAAADAKWQVALSAECVLRGADTRHHNLDLDEAVFSRSRALLTKAMRGGKLMTRAEVMGLMNKAGISTDGGRGYHLLWYHSLTGLLVAGPMNGKQQTFTLLDGWIKKSAHRSRASGLAELTKKYFISHGPATMQDFAWWSGLTMSDVKAGLAANTAVLASIKIDGGEYWMKKGLKAAPAKPRAFLLPGFDEYLLGYQDRHHVLPREHADKIVPGGNGMFLPTIIVNGQVVGTWKKTIKKDTVAIKLRPFRKLSKAELTLLQTPARQYGRFLGLDPKLVS